MVNNSDLILIINYIQKNNKMLLIIGDQYQIPPPNAKNIISDVITKEQSIAFSNQLIEKIELTEIVRQKAESDIIKLATFVRNNINEGFSFLDTHNENIIHYSQIYQTYRNLFNSSQNSKIIAYTNESVKTHNCEIRNSLGYYLDFVVGEHLMGYSNLGFPELLIENGCDYIIESITPTSSHIIEKFDNLVGKLIDMKIFDTKTIIKKLFFIDTFNENNYDFLQELIKRAIVVNSCFSTKVDYQKYKILKDKAIFMEDIYKYDGKIFTESTFKEIHPLLFTNINDLKIKHQLLEKIESIYGNIIKSIMNDNKQISESQMICDCYKVIEKDIYYGYSITCHKSQGSTYNNVIVDENDFEKLSDKWNYTYNLLESKVLEKNQMRYVAYTRAKDNLFVCYES
jgi:hypothetical protein